MRFYSFVFILFALFVLTGCSDGEDGASSSRENKIQGFYLPDRNVSSSDVTSLKSLNYSSIDMKNISLSGDLE